MHNKIAFLTAAVALWLAASCTQRDKCVENPLIESANTMTLDISKVCLSDTATVLHTDAYFHPGYWIRISSESYLLADGKRYALTGTQGIEADSLFWMPESGEASFQLTFEPLPRSTRSFDFIEGDCEDCFKLFGIDLTGKKAFGHPADVPADVVRASETVPDAVPEPPFKVGETVVHMHLSGYRKELAKEAELYLNTLMNGQQPYTATIDSATGRAEFKFWQYGPAQALISVGRGGGQVWLAPGEEIDLYVDMRRSGWLLMRQRASKKRLPQLEEMLFCYSTGTYAGLNKVYGSLFSDKYYGMNLYSGDFADYKMTAAEYTQHIMDTYRALSDSITQSGLSDVGKELALINLKEEAVEAMAQGDWFREEDYRSETRQWDYHKPLDIKIDPLTAENRAELCKLFSIADPKLLMGVEFMGYASAVSSSRIAWPKEAGLEGTFASELKLALPLVQKASNAALTEADLKTLDGVQAPFWREALLKMQENALALLKAVEGKAVIEQTPDVPVEKLFDAIIAPHKGKVILVDFWNTWCAPCRMAIKANEPLKDGELKSDNLVWIYIANQTSPLVKYKEMIPGIKGKHYRLTDKQWAYLCDKFKIDGIPSYVLVDKQGKYGLRNDFRNHGKMKDTLKEMIE